MQHSEAAQLAETFRRAAVQLDALHALVEAETAALQQGALAEAQRLAAEKAAAGAGYQSLIAELKHVGKVAGMLPAADVDDLKNRHRLFQRSLDLNLAILSTLRAVAEGILRDVSTSVATPAPGGYGPAGRSLAPASAPVSLSLRT